jgi:hypothetical protein
MQQSARKDVEKEVRRFARRYIRRYGLNIKDVDELSDKLMGLIYEYGTKG